MKQKAHKKSLLKRLLAAYNKKHSRAEVLELLEVATIAVEFSRKAAEFVAFMLKKG